MMYVFVWLIIVALKCIDLFLLAFNNFNFFRKDLENTWKNAY